MFKCSECGKEYSVKPDYCDCGNDIFVEMQDIQEQPKQQPKKKTFEEQYPALDRFIKSLDPISVIIFVICIILSVCVLVFVKPDEKQTVKNEVKQEKKLVNVPNIESFWNDTPPKAVPKTVSAQPEQIPISEPEPVVVVQPQPKPVVKPTVKPVQNTTPKTTTVKPKTVTQPQPKMQTSINKPATQTKPTQQPVTQKTTQTKPITVNQQPVKANTIKQNISNSLSAQAQQELKSYKNGLRNTIFSKINFLNVVGDGSCTVAFSVNSNGKLVNRSFSKQSSNDSLNDEVYQAIMSTPNYKTPPSSYKGQVLYFSVKYSNGQYSVSLN